MLGKKKKKKSHIPQILLYLAYLDSDTWAQLYDQENGLDFNYIV